MLQLRPAHIFLTGLLAASIYASRVTAMTAQGSLRDVLFGAGVQDDDRSTAPPPVARYVSEEGESFVLDRSSATPLIRFEDSDEVLALSPSPAARSETRTATLDSAPNRQPPQERLRGGHGRTT